MKLVGPQTSQVQSLGRHQSGLTAEAGKAAAIQTTTQGVASSLETLASVSEDILQTNTRRQAQQSDLFMKKSEKEFWEKYGGKDFFDVSELEGDDLASDIVTEGKHIKGRIASAEVLPQLYANFIKEELPRSSLIIENEKMRGEWMADAQVIATNRQQAVQTRANSDMERQIFIDQQINFQNVMDADEPEEALKVAGQMDGFGNPAIVEEHKIKARKGIETLRYKDAINKDNPVEMVEYLAHLRQPYKEYQKDERVGIAELDALERMTWISKLESALNGFKKDAANRQTINQKLLRREARMTRENSIKGHAPDQDVMQDLYQRLYAMEIADPGSMTTELADHKALISFNHANSDNLRNDRVERQMDIDLMRGNEFIPEFERMSIADDMQKSHDAQTALENTDFMQSASNAGAFKDGLSPINFDGDPSELASEFGTRFEQYRSAQADYGDGLGNGILTKDEAVSFSALINGMSAEDQVQLIASIGDEFGQDSFNVYEQLGIDGNAKSFAVAGVLASERTIPASGMAEHILIGNEFRRKPDVNLNEITGLLRTKIHETLGNSFRSNNEYNTSMQEAIIDAYISMTKDTTDLTSIDTGGWFGEDMFQKAVDGVTGGILEQGDSQIPAPEYGMTQDSWDNWIEGLNPTYIEELGGVAGTTNQQIVDMIYDGEVKFVSLSQKEFILTNDKDIPYQNKNTGGAFVLPYDPTYPSVVRNPLMRRTY